VQSGGVDRGAKKGPVAGVLHFVAVHILVEMVRSEWAAACDGVRRRVCWRSSGASTIGRSPAPSHRRTSVCHYRW
jgi:hypothetical protein